MTEPNMLAEELMRLEGLAVKVLRVHGPKDPERLSELRDTVGELREDLDPSRVDAAALAPVFGRLRELTNEYRVPEGACRTWRSLWEGLEAVDRQLQGTR